MGAVTLRRPPRVRIEPWVERQIREAQERGEFDALPGAGTPLPGLDLPHDDLWWVKDKLRRENLSYLPPALALRKEVEDAVAEAEAAGSEEEVRRILALINVKILEAIRKPPDGPPANLVPVDVERVVARWRAGRLTDQAGPAAVSPSPEPAPRERRWWLRRR